MIVIKVLNLYAGLGGNRKLWKNCQVVAVEKNPEIASVYQKLYPEDTVIVADAHAYLLDHYKEYSFIWSSPPCQSHSRIRYQLGVMARGTLKAVYPDFRLYEEIVFLANHTKRAWVVENVKPYYTPLIKPTAELQRHLFWGNFRIENALFRGDRVEKSSITELIKHHGIDVKDIPLKNKRQCLRNCVFPALGAHILYCAQKYLNA